MESIVGETCIADEAEICEILEVYEMGAALEDNV